MEKEFVPYELAVKMKSLGFNGPCFATWNGETLDMSLQIPSDDYFTKAPTFSQAFRWFREKYKLHGVVEFQKLKEKDEDEDITIYEWRINEQWQVGKDWYDFRYGFKHHSVGFNHVSYEEAELACLDKLIEIVENIK